MKDEYLRLMELGEFGADTDIDANGYPVPTEEEWENWCESMDAYHAECMRLGVKP